MSFYEGWVYANVVARLQAGLNAFICKQVEPGTSVLEAGCGTGNLTALLSERAARVLAIDHSAPMIEYARGRQVGGALANVRFVQGDITTDLSSEPDDSFDLALMVLVLHEMPQPVREKAVTELVRVARSVIIVDHAVPQPRNFAGYRNRTLERLAGRQHHAAFQDYCRRGGAEPIAREAGVRCEARRAIDAGSLTLFDLGAC